jgi:small-conductance mechanosensitive channel
MRSLLVLAMLGFALAAAPAPAQTGKAAPPAAISLAAPVLNALSPSTAPATSPAAAPAASPGVGALSPAQADRLLAVLKDDTKRADLIATLEALGKALPDQPPADKSLANPLAANSLGVEVIDEVNRWVDRASDDVVKAIRTVTNVPGFWGWLETLVTDPLARASLAQIVWRLIVALGTGFLAFLAAGALLRRPLVMLAGLADAHGAAEPAAGAAGSEPRAHQIVTRLLRRSPMALGRLALELLPVLVFALAAYGVISSPIGGIRTEKRIIFAVLQAASGYAVVMAVARTLFSPAIASLRLLPVDSAAARSGERWIRLIAAILVASYAFAESGVLLGMTLTAYATLLKLAGLAVAVCLVVVIFVNRESVAAWIRPRAEARGVFAITRRRIATVWPVIASFYVLAMWAVWALDIPNGFARLARLFFSTALIIIVVRLLLLAALASVDGWMRSHIEGAAASPGLHRRLRRYHPMVRGLISGVAFVVTAIALTQAWGLGVLFWFSTDYVGGRLAGALVTICVTFVVAVCVWEGTNAAIDAYLARLTREAQLARSARLRTLLPMLRTTLMILIIVVVILTMLSEIGVNIAPLLAGAGVIGLAIGFGSQKLVQDIITGLFLLLENAMQVGDWVELAGLGGTVENLSVRTIRLRAMDGSVHIIPFSAVTTVTNMTRDFGYAVVDVEVSEREDPDKIAEILREIAREMRAEPKWRSQIRDELELMGVDRFVGQGWVYRARIRTTPNDRWAVGRELNRRIKYRFDALGISRPVSAYRLFGGAATTALVPPGTT